MNKINELITASVKRASQVLLLSVGLMTTADAHLMVAQHGTLNIVENGAFMVLSLPVSAFKGVDDNADGRMSAAEFTKHRLAIAEVIKQSVLLYDEKGPIQIQGLLLSSDANDHGLPVPVTQIVAMGRFVLRTPASDLRFENKLFGKTEAEKLLTFTVSRKADAKKQKLELTPNNPSAVLFPSTKTGLVNDIKHSVNRLLASWE